MVVEHSAHPMNSSSGLPQQLNEMSQQPVNHADMVGATHVANLSLVKHFRLSVHLRSISAIKQV